MIYNAQHFHYLKVILHWLSPLVGVVLIHETHTIFLSLKISEGSAFYQVILISWIHAHLLILSMNNVEMNNAS